MANYLMQKRGYELGAQQLHQILSKDDITLQSEGQRSGDEGRIEGISILVISFNPVIEE